MGTHLSVVMAVAGQIVLTGEFDLAKTYDSAKSCPWAQHISDIEKGAFTFEIRGLRTVNIQVYGTGKVIINTDDLVDPAKLIRITELVLRATDYDRPIKLYVDKVRILHTTARIIAENAVRRLRCPARFCGMPNDLFARDTMAKWEELRLRRIHAQDRHPKAGELAPGGDDYQQSLGELGVLDSKLAEELAGMRVVREIRGFDWPSIHIQIEKGLIDDPPVLEYNFIMDLEGDRSHAKKIRSSEVEDRFWDLNDYAEDDEQYRIVLEASQACRWSSNVIYRRVIRALVG